MTIVTILLTLILTLWTAPARAQAPAAGANAAPQGNADSGKKLFLSRGCWTCHGYAAQGGELDSNPTGPRLSGRLPAWAGFSAYVRKPTGNMVPYTTKVLPDQQLADIWAWIKSLPAPPAVSSLPQLKD